MDSIIPLRQKNNLAEYMILSGAENHLPMLDKDLYDSWKSRMELYIQNGPLIWPTVEENGVTRTKKYVELFAAEKIQLIERECKLYDAFDKFTHIKGESLHKYYLRFTQLINAMNMYNIKMKQFQVNTKFLNSLPPEWRDDPIACLNKEMAFLTVVASSKFSSTNNQLRTSSNPINQATIQDGRVTGQQVQGRQGQSYSDTGYKSNATSSGGNNASGQERVVKCYNCQGERHMARQCTQPKRPRNAVWYNDKAMLAEAQKARQILDEVQLAFLADPGVPNGQAIQTIIPHNAAFQIEDLDTYDSDCDDVSNAKAVLMANMSNYGSNAISKKAQRIKPTFYDGIVISNKHVAMPVIDDEETLILEEVRRSKMSEKEKDPEDIKQKISIKPIDYIKLNKLYEDFEKRFVPQQELSADEAFWYHMLNPSTKSSDALLVKIEAPKELLKGVVEQPKAKQPLDNALDFACKHAQQIQELLVCVRDTCPNAIKPSAKKASITPKNNVKKVRFVEPLTSSSNIKQVESSKTSDSNTHVLSPTGLKCSTSNCRSKPTRNKRNDRILQTPRFKWKPIGRTFTIVGNSCPLTRTTSANVVPPKKTTSHSVETKKSKLKVYNRKPKNVKNVVRFGNDHIARIIGYGDYQLGNVTISRVYYIVGLRHNLFFVSQFCDTDLEVVFRKNTCFIHNLEGVDLISGSRDTNLYTVSLDNMLKTSPICLLSKASKTKSWLWNRRLSHLNFGLKCSTSNCISKPTSNKRNDRISQTPSSSKRAKIVESKNANHSEPNHTWGSNATDIPSSSSLVMTGCPDCSLTLREFYENVSISHQTSVARTPQQNDVVKRRNQTLVEAARIMLIFFKAPLFLWAEAINTTCYTKNRSSIRLRYNKTPYELMQDKKPNLSFFHVFGALCYPTNDNDDLGKLDAKADIGIFVGYAPANKAFRIYNKRTRKIIETINVTFDELITMASEQLSSGL
uniref:Integrase, catalytic region, zinc finger, CCHC-type, peptidase aspartic, catalytic n=1 Tax=Tanacetum cinerariifolium TaxID=118510 RepID=A0A6L2NA17_TANCI|nr:integrase, catalytic region, zinc finger, CCHC-type, peptidase aspartic, catalytic [Tanacetum cinerariifolium]